MVWSIKVYETSEKTLTGKGQCFPGFNLQLIHQSLPCPHGEGASNIRQVQLGLKCGTREQFNSIEGESSLSRDVSSIGLQHSHTEEKVKVKVLAHTSVYTRVMKRFVFQLCTISEVGYFD